MTGPISFRPTTPTATPTTSTPIQRGVPVNVPPAPPPPPPVRSPQAFQRSATASGDRPLDLQAEAASINTAITQAKPEQIQANAARLNQLGLVPQGMPGITPEALQTARQNLKPVSQHQVFNVHDKHESDASRSTVVESGRSVKLKQGGSPFGVGIVLKPGATVEVLGHGSPDGRTIGGKTPQQLAKQLKAGGATQLAVLDLKSCHSQAFKAELQQCLASEGIQVDQIKTYQGSIAVSRETGKVLQGAQINVQANDGELTALNDLQYIVDNLAHDAVKTVQPNAEAACWNWVLYGAATTYANQHGEQVTIPDPRAVMFGQDGFQDAYGGVQTDDKRRAYLSALINNHSTLETGAASCKLRAVGYFSPDTMFMTHIELDYDNSLTLTKYRASGGDDPDPGYLSAFRGQSDLPDYVRIEVPIKASSLTQGHKDAIAALRLA